MYFLQLVAEFERHQRILNLPLPLSLACTSDNQNSGINIYSCIWNLGDFKRLAVPKAERIVELYFVKVEVFWL